MTVAAQNRIEGDELRVGNKGVIVKKIWNVKSV